MRKQSPLKKLQEAREDAAERKRALLKRLHDRSRRPANAPLPEQPALSTAETHSEPRIDTLTPRKPWHAVRTEPKSVTFFSRANPAEPNLPQPWMRRITDVALLASAEGS